MITRILIRIKVVQMFYSYLLTKEGRTISNAKKELEKSLDKAYELYISMLVLMIDLTDYHDLKLDMAKHKYLPTELDKNPNTRFADNKFIARLRENKDLKAYLKDTPISWREDIIFMKLMHDKILHSKVYEDYMNAESVSFEDDCSLWRDLLKKVVFVDEDLLEILESKSVYWNDDLNVMGTFVLKTIKQISNNPDIATIQPKYKDEEDNEFGERLFECAVRENEENNKIIDRFVQKDQWDTERLAFMDRVILSVGLSEIKNFDNIPTKVSMNEYIEIAKFYSTPKSGQFINGIINSSINYLKDCGRITKN
ncbi:MAG: transcription antitermination protein NusB [Bacteroidales bacterium]|nr:transcription antitermination protein NusB [Bacteroidales bacterium]